MDEIAKKAIQQAILSRKPLESVDWEFDKPFPQPWHAWSADEVQWQPAKPDGQPTAASLTTLALYTWNIDFMLPYPNERMTAALAYLQKIVTQASSAAIVIGLQECTLTDLAILTSNQWIRDTFYLTDLDASFWGSRMYGTTTLIDRRLAVSSCFRVHFSATSMERDGLFVDTSLNGASLRLCNTHLESLVADPPLRPSQMKTIAGYMHEVGAAIVFGDFNAIQPFDDSLHAENALEDAYLELGGVAGAEEGMTWGQQALRQLRDMFGLSRMDKMFCCGHVTALSFERIGADVVVEGDEATRLLELGFEKAWVTDHLGLCGVFGQGTAHRS